MNESFEKIEILLIKSIIDKKVEWKTGTSSFIS